MRAFLHPDPVRVMAELNIRTRRSEGERRLPSCQIDGELMYSSRERTNPLTLSNHIHFAVHPFSLQCLLYGAETTVACFISIASFPHLAPFLFAFIRLALFVRHWWRGGGWMCGTAKLMCRRRGYATDVKRGIFLCH